MMSNEELHNVITALKVDGVSYKYITDIANISYDNFYYYRRCKHYPLVMRKKIEDSLYSHFGEVIDEYRK